LRVSANNPSRFEPHRKVGAYSIPFQCRQALFSPNR
jgi:hypothetical protein